MALSRQFTKLMPIHDAEPILQLQVKSHALEGNNNEPQIVKTRGMLPELENGTTLAQELKEPFSESEKMRWSEDIEAI